MDIEQDKKASTTTVENQPERQAQIDPFAAAAVPNMRADYLGVRAATLAPNSQSLLQTAATNFGDAVGWGLRAYANVVETATGYAGATVEGSGAILGSAYRGAGSLLGDNVVGNGVAGFGSVPETSGKFIGDAWSGYGKGFADLVRMSAAAVEGKDPFAQPEPAPPIAVELKKQPE